MKNEKRNGTIRRSLKLFSKKDKSRIYLICLIQIFNGFLDLIGIAAIGVVGALSVRGIQSRGPGDRTKKFLEIFNLENLSFQNQVVIIALFAAVAMSMRTALSIFFTRRTFLFLGNRSAKITSTLVSRLLNRSLIEIQIRSPQESLFALTTGVSIITTGIIGTLISLVSDVSLLVVMMLGITAVDPIVSVSGFTFFGCVSFLIYSFLHKRAEKLGKESALLYISGNKKILEAIHSFREIFVRGRLGYYSHLVRGSRNDIARNSAETAFLPLISKYILEITLVVGVLLISAFQFFSRDATNAIATLSIFIAASTRIAPAIMRVQQSAITLRNSRGASGPTLDLIDELEDIIGISESFSTPDFKYEDFQAKVEFKNVSFSYPGSDKPAVKDISFELVPGRSYAIVGPSGGGKTTIVDLLIGILEPDKGEILLSGNVPRQTISIWPGAVSYVPQNTVIVEGTVRDNVAFGFPELKNEDNKIGEALAMSNLLNYVGDLPLGVDSFVGDMGTKMSGGQRQRLGIARAVFTKPKLLILDEATSSLDGLTENEITKTIDKMKGLTTTLTIAHRLSTIRSADLLFYIDSGELKAIGTFQEIANQIPEFMRQISASSIIENQD